MSQDKDDSSESKSGTGGVGELVTAVLTGGISAVADEFAQGTSSEKSSDSSEGDEEE
jgi:hypothetical protein